VLFAINGSTTATHNNTPVSVSVAARAVTSTLSTNQQGSHPEQHDMSSDAM